LRFDDVDTEEFGEIGPFEHFRRLGFRHALAGIGNEVLLLDISKQKQQCGVFARPAGLTRKLDQDH
jgi:hypothetical protein